MNLLLTSSLPTNTERSLIEEISKKKGIAIIIVTAAKEHKEDNKHVQNAKENLLNIGFEVRFLDLDVENADPILSCDFLYLAGGSPHYLLKRIKELQAEKAIVQTVKKGTPVLATSAGAVVLGRSTALVDILDPNLDSEGTKDRGGLNIIPYSILPHANRWHQKVSNFSAKLREIEAACSSKILTLNDGQSMLFSSRHHYKII